MARKPGRKTNGKTNRKANGKPAPAARGRATLEVEAKLRVASLAPARGALRRIGATFRYKVVQTDRYFDSVDQRLLAGGIGVRVRLTKVLDTATPVDDRPMLTFKGPTLPDATFKSRLEAQTRMDDPSVIDRVLEAAGLAETVTVEKRRESWRLGRCAVELDTLPEVGTFVEIEGPDEAAIENVRRKLNIQGELTRDHYVTLTLEKRNTEKYSARALPFCVVECSRDTERSCATERPATQKGEAPENVPPNIELVTAIPSLPKRPRDSHKGDFGHVLVVAGSTGMAGACGLCTNGALRGGAGLVTAATPAPVQPTVATLAPCAMTIPLAVDEHGVLAPTSVRQVLQAKATVLAVGPGLGVGAAQQRLVQAVLEQDRPVVLDADGLNNLAALTDWSARRRCPMVLTPHPGEFARLTRAATRDVQVNRVEHAVTTVNDWRAASETTPSLVLVLKGAFTVVTDGRRLYVNRTGNPGLATGGSGDVLTGLLAALLAQGLSPFDAAVLATHTHGLAADLAAADVGETSLIATDLLAHIGKALKTM